MTQNVITGSSGFIGSRLSRRLSGVNLRHFDIQYGHSYSAQRFFFLSTYGNMAHHNNQQVMVKANVQDLITILNGFYGQWFCYMSSSSVTLPVQTPYSRTKRAAEEILQATGVKSCIVRPYSVTGVGEQKEHLIPTLIRSCMTGEKMPFDPYPVHDFIDVEDVVDGLILLADRQVRGLFEFGSGIPHHNQEIKELVEHFCQKKANVYVKESIREYDTDQWFCQKPQFKPAKTISQSIEEMVEAYKREHA